MVARNRRIIRCSPDDLFAVMGDGWLFPTWVVGAARMRKVDPEWPEQGSRIHHSLGIWPIMIDDTTEVVEWSPPHRVKLRAKAGPLGRGIVVIDVKEHELGCSVGMGEEPVTGPALVTAAQIWAPLLEMRNRETLRRLAFLAEGRHHEEAIGEESVRDDVPDDSDTSASPQARQDAAKADDAAESASDAAKGEEKPDNDARETAAQEADS